MPVFAKKDGKRVITPLIYIKLLVFLGLIAVSAIALRPIQTALSGFTAEIRDNLFANIEESAGVEIRYASLRPSFFGSVEARNIRIYKDGRSFLTVSKINARYSFIKLITGGKDFMRSVSIDKPVLRVDLKRDSDLFKSFNSGMRDNNFEPLKSIAEYLPKNIKFNIRDCSILLINGDFVCQFDGMNINIDGDKKDFLLDSFLSAEIRYSGFNDKTIIFFANIEINSMGNLELNSINADILLSSIKLQEQKIARNYAAFFHPVSTMEKANLSELLTVFPININLSYNGGILKINRPNGQTKADYNFYADFNTGAAEASLVADGFLPRDNIIFENELKKAEHLLDISVTGESFYIKKEDGSASYYVNFSGRNEEDDFIIFIYGDENNLHISDVSVNASRKTVLAGLFSGNINLHGDIGLDKFKPDLNLSFKDFTFTGKETANAVFEIASTDAANEENAENEILVSGKDLLFSGVIIDDFYIKITPNNDNILVKASLLCPDDNYAFLDSYFNKTPAQIDAFFNIDGFSLYNILGIISPFADIFSVPGGLQNSFLKNSKLTSEFYFSYDFNNFIYNAPDITVCGDSVLCEFSLSGTDRQFNLSHGAVYLGEDPVLINANALINTQYDFNFKVNASYRDAAWNIDGQVLDGTTLIISDPNGLHAYGNMSNNGAVSGYIEGVDYPAPIGNNIIYLNFYIALRYNSFDFWSCDILYFEARDASLIDGENALVVSGSIDQDGASFREILINDDIGLLFGNADFAWDFDLSYLQFYINMTDGYEEGENYFFDGMLRNSRLNIQSGISNMRVNRFTKDKNPMIASADMVINYDSINSFAADVHVSHFFANLKGSDLFGSGDIKITNNDLLASGLEISYSGIKAAIPEIAVSRSGGAASLKADVQGLLLEKDLDIKANLDINFSRMETWLGFAGNIEYLEGVLNFEKFHFGDTLYNDFDFIFSSRNGAVSVNGGIDEMLRLEMDENGSFYLGLSSPLPIRGSVAGVLSRDFIMDAHCNYFFIDMKTLWQVSTPKDIDFSIAGGFITGKIDIRGPVWNPEFFGEAKGSSFNIQVPSFIEQDIRPVPFNIIADGYEMAFGPAVTICGAGAGIASGWFRFENWAPKTAGIEISVPRETPIPYNIDVAGFVAEGDVSGNFSLIAYADEKMTEINGDLYMDNTEMGLNMGELLQESEEEITNHSIVQLKVTTGASAEFFWPNKINPIIRANPEMGSVLYLISDTQSGQYSLVSEISIKSGELSYLDRNFVIKQGTLFLNENEREFNPILTARAEIRDRIDSGPVTISMIIENQPLLSFEPRFETNPGITQLELYSILGQTYAIQNHDNPEEAQRFLLSTTTDIVAQAMAQSDTWGQLLFLRQAERQARDFFNLDMLSIRTRFFQNAIVGYTEYGLAGYAPVKSADSIDAADAVGISAPRVGNFFDNTTVSIGKYIGQDMFIQGTLIMRYDEYLESFNGITLEPDISIEWQSPFVNIRWSFIPANSQNWFISDNTITLSWSRSF